VFLPASIEAQRIRLVDLPEGETSEGGPVGRADRDQPHAAAIITALSHGQRPAANAHKEAAEPLTALVRLLARQAAAEALAAGDTTTFDEEPA
jgi:hypothetical protein